MDDLQTPISDEELENESKRTMAVRAVLSFVISLGILIVAIVLFITLVATKKKPKQKPDSELITAVRVEPITLRSHQVSIETQGAVRSLREVMLAAEVGGRVIKKSPSLVEGATVKKGEVLIEIDSADYKAAEARAQSAVADAKLALEQELAMAEQAAIDWKKLGRGEPTDLVLRIPQQDAARARLASAEAELVRAGNDVKRTSIRAPFDATVRRVSAEEGAVLAPGSMVAELYSTDELEVRLPITLLDYGYLSDDEKVKIQLTAKVGGENRTWTATMDRVDGEVQRSTLSAYGLAKLDEQDGLPPVGLFVEAMVPGKKLDGVVVLPRSAVRGSNEIWVEQDGKLLKREINVLRATRDEVVARGDFKPGDRLVLTRLAAPMNGMKVEALKEDSDKQDTP